MWAINMIKKTGEKSRLNMQQTPDGNSRWELPMGIWGVSSIQIEHYMSIFVYDVDLSIRIVFSW